MKAAVTPVLIGSSTWAGRRWGDAVGGWLVGLPLTSGPVVLFVSIEHGTAFGAAAAAGVLAGCLSQTAFTLAYGLASLRAGPAPSLVAGSGAFAVVTAALELAPLPLPLALLAGVASLLFGLGLLPGGRAERPASSPPAWDIPLRMALATALVLALTEAAPLLGPRLSGLLAPFPLFAAVLAVFAQRSAGGDAARDVLRGLLFGLFSFCAFFTIAALALPQLGAAFALLLAAAAALAVQGLALAALRLLLYSVS